MTSVRDRDPSTLKPREAAELWLQNGRSSEGWTESTHRDYEKNIRRFLHWCANENIESVGELTPWDIELFRQVRQSDTNRNDEPIAPTTVRSTMMTLKQFVDYLKRIGAVEEDLTEAVAEAVPTVSKEDATNDELLETERAVGLVNHYRNDPRTRATTKHVILEILWHVGCRISGLRALDVKDYDREQRTLTFRNRPETGTRLKRGADGERSVFISETVAEILNEWLIRERPKKADEYGRNPLISCRQGRPSISTIRFHTYLATQPCVRRECPHGEFPKKCEYRERSKSSKCPSSRSPHRIRTGSITWHRDRGIPLEECSKRVNAESDTIKRYYDKADLPAELERRRQYTADLDVVASDEDDSDDQMTNE